MEITVHRDKIINSFARWKQGEADRASDAGEMREEIGKVIDLTGLNKRAFSFVRMLDKQAPDKRADILRSLEPLLNLMRPHWDGSGTPDMFTENDDAVDPVDDEPIGHNGGPEWEPDDEERSAVDGRDAEIAEEADEFEKALSEAAE